MLIPRILPVALAFALSGCKNEHADGSSDSSSSTSDGESSGSETSRSSSGPGSLSGSGNVGSSGSSTSEDKPHAFERCIRGVCHEIRLCLVNECAVELRDLREHYGDPSYQRAFDLCADACNITSCETVGFWTRPSEQACSPDPRAPWNSSYDLVILIGAIAGALYENGMRCDALPDA